MGTSAGFVPAAVVECPYAPRMTRAAAIALRGAAGLKENCVVVITDGPVIGTAGNTSITEIELNPVSPTELGLSARVHTGFAASAWAGIYDIDLGTAGSITTLTDDFGNTGKDEDADSPTVHTQVPWHLGSTFFRDNYFEDAVLTAWDLQGAIGTQMLGNRVIDSTVNLTGKVGGAFSRNEFDGTTLTSGAVAFFIASDSVVRGGALNFGSGTGVGNVTLLRSTLVNATIARDPATTGGTISISNSEVYSSTLTQGAGSTGAISVTDSQLLAGSALNVDPASAKAITVSRSELLGYTVRTQDAGAGGPTISQSNCFGKPTGDSILARGTSGAISVNNSIVDGFSTAGAGAGSIEVNGPASSALIQDANIQNSRFTIGPGAGAFQTTGGIYENATINANSATGGRLTINFAIVRQGTVNHAAAASDSLQLNGSSVQGSGLVELLSGARGLTLNNVDVSNGIIRQTSVNATSVPNTTQITDCRVTDLGRIILSETTAAGQPANNVTRSTVKGSSLGGGVDGILTITGVCAGIIADSLNIQGVCTLTDVPNGALAAGTSFHDLRVGPASTLTYTAGDAAAKQIRNIAVENLSTLTITGLTGSAGVGLADVFAGVVRGQSTMTVTGARVVGQPVRNFSVENGSALNVAASGTVLQCRMSNGATLNTGAFRHSESIIDGPFVKTATAANVGKLANASFDNWI